MNDPLNRGLSKTDVERKGRCVPAMCSISWLVKRSRHGNYRITPDVAAETTAKEPEEGVVSSPYSSKYDANSIREASRLGRPDARVENEIRHDYTWE